MVKNEGKLIIARYKNKIITLKQFQHGEHWGKIHCPFCSVRVNYNSKGYFSAWPNEGGHKCRDIRVNYFDADWEGSRYVEVLEDGANIDGLKIIIDIGEIAILAGYSDGDEKDIASNSDSGLSFPKYHSMRKAFRDVVRSVSQMKRLFEKNSSDALRSIKYTVKIENETLSFDEIVFKTNQIGSAPTGKRRFFIFQVESIKPRKTDTGEQIVYINSMIVDDFSLATVIKYPYPLKRLKDKFTNKYVMAYGKVSRAQNDPKKIYVNISNDFHVVTLDEDEVACLFDDCKVERYNHKQKEVAEVKVVSCESVTLTPLPSSEKEAVVTADVSVRTVQTQPKPEITYAVVKTPTIIPEYKEDISGNKEVITERRSVLSFFKQIFRKFRA